MMKKIGIYARQSRGDGTSGSIEDQILKGRIKAKELELDIVEYVDRGKSAYNDNFENRPEFQRLLQDIEDEKISDVFVYDNSRLTRNSDTNYHIKKIFKQHNVTVHTEIDGSTDFSSSQSILMSDIKALFNMKFVEDTSLKIKSVLKNNAQKGRAPSGALKPFGYTSDENKMLIIEVEEAEIVKEIYKLCLNGKGCGAIAKTLNLQGVKTKTHRLILQGKIGQNNSSIFSQSAGPNFRKWAPNTVMNILKNPLYKGQRKHKDEFYDAPAIIEPQIWDEVQREIKKHRNAPGLSKHSYLLKNLCYCGRCGSSFCGRTRHSKRDHYYYCSSRVKAIDRCGIRSINIDTLEDLIWMIVCKSDLLIMKARDEVAKLQTPESIIKLKKDKTLLETQLSSLNRAKHNLISLIGSEDITLQDAKEQLSFNKSQIEKYTESLTELNLKINHQNQIISSINYVAEFLTDWDNLAFSKDFDLKYSLVRLFIEKIIIEFDDVEELYTINVFAKIPAINTLHTLKVDKKGDLIEEDDISNGNGNNSNSLYNVHNSKKPQHSQTDVSKSRTLDQKEHYNI